MLCRIAIFACLSALLFADETTTSNTLSVVAPAEQSTTLSNLAESVTQDEKEAVTDTAIIVLEPNRTLWAAEVLGQRTIKSIYGGYLRAMYCSLDDDSRAVDMSMKVTECEQWYIEAKDGKVIIKTYTKPHRYLTAKAKENAVLLEDNAYTQELWTPEKSEINGLWSFKSVNGTWLRAQPHGHVSLQLQNGGDESFQLTPWIEPDPTTASTRTEKRSPWTEVLGQRKIKSKNYGTFLRALFCISDIDTRAVDMAPRVTECEQWYIEEKDGKVVLKTYSTPHRYLRSHTGTFAVDLADKVSAHELWTPVRNEDRSWSFKSYHDTWLRAQPHAQVTLSAQNGADESFRVEAWTETTPRAAKARTKTVTEFPITFIVILVSIVVLVISGVIYSMCNLREARHLNIRSLPPPMIPKSVDNVYETVKMEDCLD